MNEETADEENEEETEEDRHEKDVSPPRKRVKRASDQKVTFYVNIQTAVNTVTKGRGVHARAIAAVSCNLVHSSRQTP